MGRSTVLSDRSIITVHLIEQSLNYDLEDRSAPEQPRMTTKKPTGSQTAEGTKAKLRRAAREVVCERGLVGASARTIAGQAQVNQALIFYHFGSLSELLEAASAEAIQVSVEYYRAAFAQVATFDELVTVARELQERERAIGNVAFMAQMLSGATQDPVLARATRYAMDAWTAEVRTVLERVLANSPAGDLIDTAGLADLVCAGFIGIELYGSADQHGAERAVDTLEEIGRLVDVLAELGPVARRALRAKTRPRR